MHVNTMLTLRHAYFDLNEVQDLVDIARITHARNQEFQLEMDRKQLEINEKRSRIELAMSTIAIIN